MTIAFDTNTNLPASVFPVSYSHFVDRLCSTTPHTNLVPPRVMAEVLRRALREAPLVDQAKKALMYGKDRPVIAGLREGVLASVNPNDQPAYPPQEVLTGLQRLHAALGMRSEADELLRQELAILEGAEIAISDHEDEAGDVAWYWQLYANAIGSSVARVVLKNIAKLQHRYPGGSFDAACAISPDKAAEAVAQAGARS